VRILSLDPEDMMSMLAVQAVSAVPDSLLLIDSPAADTAGKGEDEGGVGGLFLNIGARLSPVSRAPAYGCNCCLTVAHMHQVVSG
jgi:hypothetical protein